MAAGGQSRQAPEGVAAAPRRGGDSLARVTARAGYMMGHDARRTLSTDQTLAWEGFLEVSARLRRKADLVLQQCGDLSVSMLGVMGRLAGAEQRTLHQTDVSLSMGLSLSRVSRIVDILERRGLVTRRRCPSDARATNVTLTDEGLELTAAAQDAVYAFVQDTFLAPLSDDEVRVLAEIMGRLLRDPSRLPEPEPPADAAAAAQAGDEPA